MKLIHVIQHIMKWRIFTEVNGTAQNACLNLSSYNIFDTIKIDVQLRVPSDASPGIKGGSDNSNRNANLILVRYKKIS